MAESQVRVIVGNKTDENDNMFHGDENKIMKSDIKELEIMRKHLRWH